MKYHCEADQTFGIPDLGVTPKLSISSCGQIGWIKIEQRKCHSVQMVFQVMYANPDGVYGRMID